MCLIDVIREYTKDRDQARSLNAEPPTPIERLFTEQTAIANFHASRKPRVKNFLSSWDLENFDTAAKIAASPRLKLLPSANASLVFSKILNASLTLIAVLRKFFAISLLLVVVMTAAPLSVVEIAAPLNIVEFLAPLFDFEIAAPQSIVVTALPLFAVESAVLLFVLEAIALLLFGKTA